MNVNEWIQRLNDYEIHKEIAQKYNKIRPIIHKIYIHPSLFVFLVLYLLSCFSETA